MRHQSCWTAAFLVLRSHSIHYFTILFYVLFVGDEASGSVLDFLNFGQPHWVVFMRLSGSILLGRGG